VREQFADGLGQTQTGRWILRSQAKSQKWWPPIARQLFTKAEIRPGGTALNVRPSLFSGPPWPAGHAGAAMSAPARVPLAAIPT